MDSSVEKSQHRVNTERNGTGEVSQTDRRGESDRQSPGRLQEWSQQEWQLMGTREKERVM